MVQFRLYETLNWVELNNNNVDIFIELVIWNRCIRIGNQNKHEQLEGSVPLWYSHRPCDAISETQLIRNKSVVKY